MIIWDDLTPAQKAQYVRQASLEDAHRQIQRWLDFYDPDYASPVPVFEPAECEIESVVKRLNIASYA